GDGRMRATLVKAGVKTARAVIAVSSDDAANLGTALETRALNEKVRTVVRLFDADFAAKVKNAFHIDAAMGAFMIGAPTFAAAALYKDVRSAFILDDRLCVVINRPVGMEWQGKTPSALHAGCGIRVLMRRAAGEQAYSTANPAQSLAKDDLVI